MEGVDHSTYPQEGG